MTVARRSVARLLLAPTLGLVPWLAASTSSTYAFLQSYLVSRVDQQLRARRLGGPARARLRRTSPARAADPTPPAVRRPTGRSGRRAATSSGPPAHRLRPARRPTPPERSPRRPSRPATIRSPDGPTAGPTFDYRVVAVPVRHGGTSRRRHPARPTSPHAAPAAARRGGSSSAGSLVLAVVVGPRGRPAGLRPLDESGRRRAPSRPATCRGACRPAEPGTEVGRLGLALNAMLGADRGRVRERATASEERLRRFVADASHELRTPLTSIRGYAELFRRGAAERPEDPPRRWPDRGGGRADGRPGRGPPAAGPARPGAAVGAQPVDLAALAADAVEDARAVEPDRPIDLDGADDRSSSTATRTACRQVARQPARERPRTHARRRRRSTVRVGEEDGDAVLEVADEGPGIPPEDARPRSSSGSTGPTRRGPARPAAAPASASRSRPRDRPRTRRDPRAGADGGGCHVPSPIPPCRARATGGTCATAAR